MRNQMQKFNNLESDEQHIDEQHDELNEKQRDIKKQATDILTSIKNIIHKLQEHFKRLDISLREIQNQLFNDQRLQAELKNQQNKYGVLWSTFRKTVTRYSFEPPKYHIMQGIFDHNLAQGSSLSIGITRSQFEANEKDEVSNFATHTPHYKAG